MGQIWLHIGSPKTGTTSLQGFLHANQDVLRAQDGVNYVQSARANIAHNRLATAARAGEAEPLLDQIVEEVEAEPDACHVISSEMLFNPQTARRMVGLIPDALKERTKVLVYLRRQDSYLEALYKQFLKNSRIPADRQAFLEQGQRRARYLEVLNNYAKSFGRESIIARPYSGAHLIDGDIVHDFAHQIGLTLRPELQLPERAANKTFSAALSELLAALGESTEFNLREVIRELIAIDHPGTIRARDVFTAAERRRFMDGMTRENRKLVRLYMPDAAELFDITDLETAPKENKETLLERDIDDRIAAQEALMKAIGNLQRRRKQELELATEKPEGLDEDQAVPSWYRQIYPAGDHRGWYRSYGDHAASFVDRGTDQLVVSFDNLSQSGNTSYAREPWAQKFCEEQGVSHLGIYAQLPRWFRDAELIAGLEALRDEGFFERFARIAFTGTSMGAFAALAFSSLAPGATVLAFSPQTTLDEARVPWEARFNKGRAADWSL